MLEDIQINFIYNIAFLHEIVKSLRSLRNVIMDATTSRY